MESIDETALHYFATMVKNGHEPSVIAGGPFDGLRYFAIELDGVHYLVSEIGLLTPAEVAAAQE